MRKGCAMKSDRTPNWKKWLLMPDVCLWQAATLSLNVDPDLVTYEYGDTLEGEIWGEDTEFQDRLDVLKANIGRAVRATELSMAYPSDSKIFLRDFAVWAIKIGWDIPNELAGLATSGNADPLQSSIEEWKSRRLWTLAEASYLLAGEVPPTNSLSQLIEASHGAAGVIYRDLKDAVELGELNFYESRTNEFGTRRVDPSLCVHWALTRSINVPSALRELADKQPVIEDNKDQQLKGKQLMTAYRLILGMAMTCFKYDPRAPKSDAASRISATLETVGISVSDDTVRNWLDEAKERVSYK